MHPSAPDNRLPVTSPAFTRAWQPAESPCRTFAALHCRPESLSSASTDCDHTRDSHKNKNAAGRRVPDRVACQREVTRAALVRVALGAGRLASGPRVRNSSDTPNYARRRTPTRRCSRFAEPTRRGASTDACCTSSCGQRNPSAPARPAPPHR
jgi:hypothetical protein